jgi:hypothetical protein
MSTIYDRRYDNGVDKPRPTNSGMMPLFVAGMIAAIVVGSIALHNTLDHEDRLVILEGTPEPTYHAIFTDEQFVYGDDFDDNLISVEGWDHYVAITDNNQLYPLNMFVNERTVSYIREDEDDEEHPSVLVIQARATTDTVPTPVVLGTSYCASGDVGHNCTFALANCDGYLVPQFEGATHACSQRVTTPKILPPIKSARLISKNTFKYGRFEITARLPCGDWLRARARLVPTDYAHGSGYLSGEIVIFDSRGNNVTYPSGGADSITQGIHVGTSTTCDLYSTHSDQLALNHTEEIENDEDLSRLCDDYHLFGVKWDADTIETYLDDAITNKITLYNESDVRGDFWTRGVADCAAGPNPWEGQDDNAPFDQRFNLVIELDVGGYDGFFPDSMYEKPWVDINGDNAAPLNFWNARSMWNTTWEKPTLEIDSVFVYQ